MSETSRLPRAASQTGPSAQPKPPATFSSAAPGGTRRSKRGSRRTTRPARSGGEGCPLPTRTWGARTATAARTSTPMAIRTSRRPRPSRRGSSCGCPTPPTRISIIRGPCAAMCAGDIVARHDRRLAIAVVIRQGSFRSPCAGSTLSPTAVTAILDCRRSDARGRSVSTLEIRPALLGFVVCARSSAEGSTEPAEIASNKRARRFHHASSTRRCLGRACARGVRLPALSAREDERRSRSEATPLPFLIDPALIPWECLPQQRTCCDVQGGYAAGPGGWVPTPSRPRDDDTAVRVGTAPRVTGTESAVVGGPIPPAPPRHPPAARAWFVRE